MAQAPADVFARSAYDPTTQKSASVFDAAATQVRADFAKDTLAEQHNSGKINDQQYVQGLQGLAKQYRQGIGIERGITSAAVGAAQQVAANYIQDVQESQKKFLDEAATRWNKAMDDYAVGAISDTQFKQESRLYREALSGQRAIPDEQKTTAAVLSGKQWNQYKSGRVKDIVREKQLKAIYKKVVGKDANANTVDALAGSEGTKKYIEKELRADFKVKRDIGKERAALNILVKKLGRLPTKAEIDKQAYGK